jgi:hypothetical protein
MMLIMAWLPRPRLPGPGRASPLGHWHYGMTIRLGGKAEVTVRRSRRAVTACPAAILTAAAGGAEPGPPVPQSTFDCEPSEVAVRVQGLRLLVRVGVPPRPSLTVPVPGPRRPGPALDFPVSVLYGLLG